jgi:hypothetical protein
VGVLASWPVVSLAPVAVLYHPCPQPFRSGSVGRDPSRSGASGFVLASPVDAAAAGEKWIVGEFVLASPVGAAAADEKWIVGEFVLASPVGAAAADEKWIVGEFGGP